MGDYSTRTPNIWILMKLILKPKLSIRNIFVQEYILLMIKNLWNYQKYPMETLEIHWRNTQGHLNQMRGENAMQVFFAFIFIPRASKYSNCSIFLTSPCKSNAAKKCNGFMAFLYLVVRRIYIFIDYGFQKKQGKKDAKSKALGICILYDDPLNK